MMKIMSNESILPLFFLSALCQFLIGFEQLVLKVLIKVFSFIKQIAKEDLPRDSRYLQSKCLKSP